MRIRPDVRARVRSDGSLNAIKYINIYLNLLDKINVPESDHAQ